MQPGYRDKIIMHAFYPKKQRFANSNVLRTVLFYASLFELAENGILVTEDTRFWCRERAIKRYKEHLGSEFHREDKTIYQLRKSLKKTLDTQKAVRAVIRT